MTNPKKIATTSKGSEPEPGRCGAKNRNGSRCRKWPLLGTNRCRLHGGASPQAQAKARERILGAADLAARRLIEFMNDKRVPWPVRLTAARDLLDRAGLSAKTVVEVEAPWQTIIEGIVADVPDTVTVAYAARKRDTDDDDDDDSVIDAEVIEDDRSDPPDKPRELPAPLPIEGSANPPAYLAGLLGGSDGGSDRGWLG